MKARLQATLSLILACFLLILPPMTWAQDGGNSLITAEAFLDDPDLAPGAGIPLTLTGDPLQPWNEARKAVDLTGQTAGVHTIYVRFKDAYGDWSDPIGQSFYIPEGSLGSGGNVGGANRIQTAEAFFDTDPGSGAGFPVAVPVDGAIDASSEVLRGLVSLGGVSPGQHTVYFRFKDTAGVWSAPLGQSVTITPELIGSAGANALTAAEYRLDAGAFQTTTVVDGTLGGVQELVDQTKTVSNDYHTFRVRFQNSAGHWSQTADAPLPNPDDNDNDGLSDAWEQQWFGNLNQSGSDDPDGDGLTNAEEQQRGTDPLTPNDSSLVAYYPFNSNANDESGNSNDGTVYNATLTEDRFGNADSAYYFDGIDDYITLPHSEQINFSSDDNYSIALWAKVISIPSGGGGILEKWSESGGYPFAIRYNATGSPPYTYTGIYDGTNNPGPQSDKDLIDGDFHQIIFVKSDNSILLYIDGQLEDSVSDTTTGSIQNSSVVYVGRRLNNNRYFNGIIDDIRIYNRALSETEIQNLYDGGGSSGTAPEATIDSITPTNPTEGDLVEFTGSAGPADQVIEQYHWSAARLVGGVPEAARLDIGSTSEFISDILPAGDWRIYLQVRNSDNAWSAPAIQDITVRSSDGLSDPAVLRNDLSLRDQEGAVVLNPEQGDELLIHAQVRNLGTAYTPQEATVRVFDGAPADGRLVSQATIAVIPSQGSVELDLPWKVGYDLNGSPLAGYQDGYQLLTVQVDYTANIGQTPPPVPEVTDQNNQATLSVIVGPVAPSLYGIDLDLFPVPAALYAGRTVTLSGIANYQFGSLWPVLGASVTVELNGQTFTTRTTSPSGTFAVSVRLPSTPGSYVATVSVFDNNLYAQETLPLDVVTAPASWPEPPPNTPAPPLLPKPSKDLTVAVLDVSGDGVYRMETGQRAAVVGSVVTPFVSIQNIGNLSTEAGFDVSFYDGNPDEGGLLIDTVPVNQILVPYQSITVTSAQHWPLAELGSKFLYVRIDAGNTVEEVNEYNNLRSSLVSVREYRPDFTPYTYQGNSKVSGLRFSGSPVVGDPVTIYVDVYNRGPAAYLSGSVPVSLFRSDPAQGRVALGTVSAVGNLDKGGKATAALSLNTAALGAGSYTIYAEVDEGNGIPEDLETNNKTQKKLTVLSSEAKLYPVSINFSNPSPVIDRPITIYATIGNSGRNAGGGTVLFYNGNPSAGGQIIGSAGTSVLDGGSQETVSIAWTTPSTPGVYPIYAEIDDHQTHRNLTVTDKPRPDLQVFSEDIGHAPWTPLEGEEVSVWATIRNVSSEVASAGLMVYFYIDSPAGFVQLGSGIRIDNLPANGSLRVDADATLRADQPYYVIRVDLVPNIQQGEANFADNAATTSFGVYQPPEEMHSISGWLTDTQGGRLAGVTVNLTGDTTDTTTTAYDGSYYFDVTQPGLYRVEPGAVPDGELYPKDAQGNTYREVEIIDPAKGVSNVSFTQNQRASFVKLLFPRAGDKLQGDFGLFGTAFRYTGCVTETDCPLIDGLLLSINGTQIYSGTLLGGASDRFALSQVVWRDMQGKPVNASWEQLIPGSGDVSLQVGVHNREDGWGFSEAVIVSRANTTATASIQPDVTLPTVAPANAVTLNSQITGATAARTAWFVFRRDENGEEFDARHPDETASIVESYPKEDVYPTGLAIVDNDGNTLVDVLHTSVYRPAYKGDPRMSRAGSRLAALGVNVVSGNFYYQTTDMSLSGVGLPFELWRRYSSLSYPNEDQERSELGQGGWGHSYDYAIFLSKSGRRLFLALPDGHWERYAYVEDADGQNRQWRTEVPGSPYRVVENGNGFKVYDRDQTAYTFDHVYWTSEHGGVFRPTRIEDTNGNALEIAYDANHRVATITDTLPTPRISILFTYNAEGFLSKVADGTGRDVEYFYNAGGNLATFRDRRGQVWVYNYVDCAGKTLLSRISDPLGNDLITNTYSYVTSGVPLTHYDGYDGECRVSSQTDGQGNQWTISYNSPSETVVTNPLSQTTTYVINDTHMVTQVTDPNDGVASKSYTLDAVEVRDRTLANTLTSPRQLDTQLSYAGSVQGNPTQITDPANRQMTLTWQEDANAQNSSCTTNPDPETGGCNNRNLLTALRLPGTSQDYTLSYDANSQVDRVTDPLARTVNYAYNSRGQVMQRTDPLGRITAYSYDPQGFLTKTTDPLNNEETYTYDAQGRIQTTTNRRGYTTTLEYNENDQLTRLTDPNGNAIVYSYDNAGNLTAVQDKRGFTTTYTYNGANRLATATRSDGQGHTYTVTYQYDGLLRLRQVTNARNYATTRTYAPSATGEQQTVVNPLGEYTVMQYDLDGHLAQVEQRAANDSVLETLEYTRDALGRVLTATRRRADNNPLTTTYTYNELGKVASIRDPKQITTSLEYDQIGRLTQTRRDVATVAIAYDETSVLPNYRVIVTDPNNHDTVYTYDALERLISKADPLGNVWRYEYDKNGNLRYYRNADNQATEFVYDKLDRLTLVRYPDGSTVDYDHDGNGNVVSLTDTLGVSTQTFDGLNRLLSRADSFGQTVGYGYDGNSNITAITYPGSHTVNYGYDPVDRMTSVQDWLGHTTSYSYDAASRLVGIVNGNGTETALSYDPAGRLTGYANRQSDNSVISEHQYVLDDNGNPITATVTQPLPLNLTPASHSFSYDQANRLLSGPEGSVQHDTDGNLTVENRGAQQIQYSYDDAHRLTGWTDGTDSYTYRYAGNGVRMATVENGVETRYVVDMNKGLPDVLARTDDNGQVQDYFVYGAAGLINRITPTGDSYVYHFDPTGSTLAMTDAGESIVNQYAYTPYGQVRRQTTVDNPFEYVGRYGVMAEANGLNFMRARFYHPDFRRFVSQDPIWGNAVEAHSLNLYGYVGGSPVGRIDPSGWEQEEVPIKVLGYTLSGASEFWSGVLEYAKYTKTSNALGYLGKAIDVTVTMVTIANTEEEGRLEKTVESTSELAASWQAALTCSAPLVAHPILAAGAAIVCGIAGDIVMAELNEAASSDPVRDGLSDFLLGRNPDLDLAQLRYIVTYGGFVHMCNVKAHSVQTPEQADEYWQSECGRDPRIKTRSFSVYPILYYEGKAPRQNWVGGRSYLY